MRHFPQKGFTLVEIMVVIMIVGLLSAMAVNGYTSYRRSALADLSGDNLVAEIVELQSNTIHGTFNDNGAECFGIKFVGGIPVAYRQDFDSRKVWNPVLERFETKGCGGAETDLPVTILDPSVQIVEVTDENGVSLNLDLFELRFLPPSGNFEYTENGTDFGLESDGTDDFASLVLQFGENPDYQTTVKIDLKTGKASNV